MQIITAKNAKTHFGELVDTMQREPVLLTKNNRPVGIFVSLEDLKGTHLAELFTEKETGHDEWVQAQVGEALHKFKSDNTQGTDKNTVHARIMEKVRTRLAWKN